MQKTLLYGEQHCFMFTPHREILLNLHWVCVAADVAQSITASSGHCETHN